MAVGRIHQLIRALNALGSAPAEVPPPPAMP
jgi:hypothetical protein